MNFGNQKAKPVGCALMILSILFAITILGLDIGYQTQVISSASISMSEYNSNVNYSGIYSATIVLAIVFSFCLVVSTVVAFFYPSISIFISALVFLLLQVPREAIYYKFSVCFTLSTNGIIISRASLTFLFCLLILAANICLFIASDDDSSVLVLKILGSLILLASLIAILILNILTLVYLRTPTSVEISPYKIDIGYFNSSEISQIQSGTFVKDTNFNLRLIGKLSDIIYSNNKRLAYRSCSSGGKRCRSYYFRKMSVQITCNSNSSVLYTDCSSADYLNIDLQYLDNSGYPVYNCGYKKIQLVRLLVLCLLRIIIFI